MIQIICGKDQSVFQAVDEEYGANTTYIDAFSNAHHSKPDPKYVEKYGQPIATVSCRQHESFYVYMLKTEQARRLAVDAIEAVTVKSPIPVSDMTVLYLNQDGLYTVADNGEEVNGLDRADAIRVIVENLTA